MARGVQCELTAANLTRLQNAPNEVREFGDPADNTRLIVRWGDGATEFEKNQLLEIVTRDPTITGSKVKATYPAFRVFTTRIIGQEVVNLRRRVAARQGVQQEQVDGALGSNGMVAKSTLPPVDHEKNGAPTHPAPPTPAAEGRPAPAAAPPAKKKPPSSAASMYKSDGTVAQASFCNRGYSADGKVKASSSASVASAAKSIAVMSFNGKSIAGDGSVQAPGRNPGHHPVLTQVVEAPIGGGAMMSQVCIWQDSSQNWRASLRLTIANYVVMLGGEKTLNGRISTRDPYEIIFGVGLSPSITHPDTALEYALERMKEAYPHLTTDEQRRALLHMHPRYLAFKNNMEDLLNGKEEYIADHRVRIVNPMNKTKPCMKIADQLVLASEDQVFYGTNVAYNKDYSVSVTYEFKEKSGKPFVPVNTSGRASMPVNAGSPLTSFAGAFSGASPFQTFKIDTIPEEVFASRPRFVVDEEDEASNSSSISSKPVGTKSDPNEMDVDEDDFDDQDYDPSEEVFEQQQDIQTIIKEQAGALFREWMQAEMEKKRNETAGSVLTRGSEDRETKRKTQIASNKFTPPRHPNNTSNYVFHPGFTTATNPHLNAATNNEVNHGTNMPSDRSTTSNRSSRSNKSKSTFHSSKSSNDQKKHE